MPLTELNHVPQGFLTSSARNLHCVLSGPTLIHLQGEQEPALFVSVLLHGDEDAGLLAIQQVLRHLGDQRLPRSLSLFVGNVAAAQGGVRHLDTQPDFNRIWGSGSAHGIDRSGFHALAQAVLNTMRERQVFATIDLHNNTGRNPLYACLSSADARSRKLAALFSSIAVHTESIEGTLGQAFAPLGPVVTCECGEIGNAQGVERAAELVERCLGLTPAQWDALPGDQLRIYQAYATIKIPASLSIGIDGSDPPSDIQLSADLDLMNFRPLPAGFILARVREGLAQEAQEALLAWDANQSLMNDVFVRDGRDIRLKSASMAAMLTTKERAIRQTCLGYLMRPYRH